MSNVLENKEEIMDDTNIKSKANSKEDDHIKLQEDQQTEQFSIENANQDSLSKSDENITTITSATTSATGKQLISTVYSDTESDIALNSENKEDVSSTISKRKVIIGSNTNEENKESYDSKLQEDTNLEHSNVEKEMEKEHNVSTIDKEEITISENITSKSIATTPTQLQCSVNSCSDSEVAFKAESKVMTNDSTIAEHVRNDVGQNLEIRFEEKNESVNNSKLIEEGKSSHSCLKLQKNVSINCIEQKFSPENIVEELISTKRKQLLCSAYSDSNSDSEISLKDDNEGKFCSMYSDSESEESLEKEKNEKDSINEKQSKGILKYKSKILKDSQNTINDLQALPTVTDLNIKETDTKSNLELCSSALSNKKVELVKPNEEQEVQTQNFNVLKDLGDPHSEPIHKDNFNKISSEMQDLPKKVDKDFDMSVLFEPNEDSRSSSFTTQTEEKCDNSVTEQLYKEFSKIIEDEHKESKPPENITENKVVKTITPNLENIIFRDFSINLTHLESTLGCKPVEMLQDIDVESVSEWATLLVSQLSIRDELISTLYNSIEKLVQKGTNLEEDFDYQQIKITELKQQVKKKKRKHKHKSCQTIEENSKSWKEYYEAYPHTYAQHYYQNNQWPVDYEGKDSSTNESSEELVKNKENLVRFQDDLNDKNQMASETKETKEKDIIQTKNTSKSKLNRVVKSSDNGKNTDGIIETLIDEAKNQQSDELSTQIGTEPVSQIGTADITESDNHGWDSSKSISDQVVAAASQIVEGTGYAYDQETGLYYDYNSGYYYNAETGLYYDSNSGTYFYYDHTTQAYQFHSQVTPENYENAPKSGNKRKIKSLEETNIPENGLYYDSNSGTYFFYDQRTQAYEWMVNGFYSESKIATNFEYDYTSQAYAEWNENSLCYDSNVDHTNQAYTEWNENSLCYNSNVDPTNQGYTEWSENGVCVESNDDHASQANEECKKESLDYKSNIDLTRQAYEEWKENGLDYNSKFGTYFYNDYTIHSYDKLLDNDLSYDINSGKYFYHDQVDQAYKLQSQNIPKKKKKKEKTIKRKTVDNDILKEEEIMSGEEHIPLKKKKCKVEKETNGEKEDGECSESEEFSDGLDGVYGLNELSNEESEEDMEKEVKDEVNEEVAISQSEVPPSLRLMVIQSEAKRVSVGSLHMVTVDGGTAGRESNNIVHLQDISVSKVHARFIFHSNGPSDFHYYVKDLGSNNGTFVNAIRLSEPRQESQEKELGHGWLLRLGQVTLKCHIHPGILTCNECEPGLVAKNTDKKKEGSGYKSVKSREKARKKEMKALKKKYALSYSDQSSLMSSEYKDRAENRRLVVGSDNPYEKTEVASTETALTSKNKGFKMLEKMGWTEGHGIGKTTGLIEPIQPESSVGRSGLGSMVMPVPETTPNQTNRKKILGITQERFNKL